MAEKKINKHTQVAIKLNQLTLANKIKWTYGVQKGAIKYGGEPIFGTDYNESIIRIYPAIARDTLDISLILQGYMIVLELINEDGDQLFDFSSASQQSLKDLYNSIKYQFSGAPKFIDDILKE